jgi:hypothetical protein
VYPAASLVREVAAGTPIYVVDPEHHDIPGAHAIRATASAGMSELWRRWLPEVPEPAMT